MVYDKRHDYQLGSDCYLGCGSIQKRQEIYIYEGKAFTKQKREGLCSKHAIEYTNRAKGFRGFILGF